jgi:uncharacterized membrane protein YedE/YeeE
MIPHWPFWLGAIGLAGVALLHWIGLGRLMAVSGSFSAIVNRARGTGESMSEDALLRASAAEFGGVAGPEVVASPRTSLGHHTVFLLGLVGGGFVSAVLAGAFHVTPGLRSEELASILGTRSPLATLPLCAIGGVLVGFGTRMASGCTSGHGLCGVSRLQVGSLAATMAFFGTGIVVSFVLGAFA